MFIGNLQLQV